MHIYKKIYEFAASAGAFEGYVYHKKKSDIDMAALTDWADNLLEAYTHLAAEIRDEFQSSCDRTLGRAVRSLVPLLGQGHAIIQKLQAMIVGGLPESADDFQEEKMKKELIISGKIVGGVKQGAFFTQLEWFQEQCLEKLNFKPFPGTLNIEIPADDVSRIEALEDKKGVEFIPPDAAFCTGKGFPVSAEGINGAIIIPAQEVRVHAQNVIEVIAPLPLKKTLKKTDGDSVTLTIHET
ncbi:MAG: CTP-dependent riboflavin kinase [Desulfobacterales bacterium]|jgi:CTP-dependent riboflavin kinase